MSARRRGAVRTSQVVADLEEISELKKRELPGRRLFTLKSEGKVKKASYVEGDAQKQELKGITAVWLNYFNEKQVSDVLFNAVEAMLHLLELPENPFVFIANRLRTSEVSYGLVKRDRDFEKMYHKKSGIQFQTLASKDALTQVTNIKNNESLWGLEHILKIIDPLSVEHLLARIDLFPCMLSRGSQKKGEYKLEYVTALTGNAVFHGPLLPHLPETIQLEQDCHVQGPKFEKGATNFAQVIIGEVEALNREEGVILFGVKIEESTFAKAGRKSNSSTEPSFKLWTANKIKASKNSFTSAIKAATQAKRKIFLQMIVDLPFLPPIDKDSDEDRASGARQAHGNFDDEEDDNIDSQGFIAFNTLQEAGDERNEEPGRLVEIHKIYSMHFQQTNRQGEVSGELRSFAKLPFSCLCLGVFLSKQDATFYAKLHVTASGECWSLKDRELYSDFSQELKNSLLKKYIGGDLTDAVEVLTCHLAMEERHSVLDDIFRLMQSSAGQLRGVICWSRAMCSALEHLTEDAQSTRRRERGAHVGFSDPDFIDLIVQQFPSFRKHVLTALADTNSSDIRAMQRPIRHALYDMCDHVSKRLIVDERHTARQLEHIQYLCEALECSVSRDVFEALSNPYFHDGHESGDTLISLIEGLLKSAITPTDSEQTSKPGGEKSSSIFNEAGMYSLEALKSEAAASRRARANVRVVSVPNAIKTAKKQRKVPMEIAREATLLRYVTDTRIDKVLYQIAMELFTSGKLYPNPYLQVVSRVRAEALRHHLWHNSDQQLIHFVSGARSRVKLVEPRCWLYKLAKENVFGVFSALRISDGPVLTSVMSKLKRADVILPERGPKVDRHENSAYDEEGGVRSFKRNQGHNHSSKGKVNAYEITISSSICGNTVLYSRIHTEDRSDAIHDVDDILRENPSISMTEYHVYEGPKEHDALELFADYLVSQVLHQNDKTDTTLLLSLATGICAMDLLNADPGYDGGWAPVSHHAAHHTREEDNALHGNHGMQGLVDIRDHLSGEEEHVAHHDEEFYKEANKKMHHPRYSHGENLQAHQIRREQALCKQEVCRAVKAHEPIVVELCVLINPSKKTGSTNNQRADAEKETKQAGVNVSADEGPYYIIVRKLVVFTHVQTPSGKVSNFCPEFMKYDTLYRNVWFEHDQASVAIHVICSGLDQENSARIENPCDEKSKINHYYDLSLKIRIAHAFSQGDFVKVYRSLFRLMLQKRNVKLLPDLIRMLNRSNIALEFDMLISLNMLIKGLFMERFSSDESRRKVKAKLLKQQFVKYKESVEVLLADSQCIFLPGIRNAVHALLIKIGAAIDADRGGESTIHMERLEELHAYLECLRLAASSAFHLNCPKLDQLCKHYALEFLPLSETAFLK